jgi:lycopene cyclase domain-containing protein
VRGVPSTPITVPEYTIAAVVAVAAVVGVELAVLRTGIFRRPAYWLAMAIVFAFQVPVDGWLTKLSAPIVLYDEERTTGWRVPWDIPVEDFLFGFALLTLVLVLWERQRTPGPGEDDA